jgi:hypothetical protein
MFESWQHITMRLHSLVTRSVAGGQGGAECTALYQVLPIEGMGGDGEVKSEVACGLGRCVAAKVWSAWPRNGGRELIEDAPGRLWAWDDDAAIAGLGVVGVAGICCWSAASVCVDKRWFLPGRKEGGHRPPWTVPRPWGDMQGGQTRAAGPGQCSPSRTSVCSLGVSQTPLGL